ncbi:cytochrome c [Pelagibacterium sp. 26DY04]|uniref:c-type cytochrome n=1 Tax=unclassified Pelagibacterium TaxID=2623280 RepID=UPI0028156BB7|nr:MULTISPECIES: cytochrome c [unclassified Pelagibacterium]WMT85662.1 cytochrome c [Pelagibacterium sp. 26DY04]WMT90055.1 cytochrome c [Pelagibacterium sp. H642]
MKLHAVFGIGLCLASWLPLSAQAQDEPAQIASFTAEQVAAGEREYTRSCQDCHGANLDDGEFGGPPLIGVNFRDKWFDLPASGLYGFTSAAMPPDRPGRLSAETYANLVAFILSENGLEAGDTPLPSDMEALSELALR